jgi:hypothetical protein
MTTATASQAARIAEHLDVASERALAAWVCVHDVSEILTSPDDEPVPPLEALALVGRAAYARRHAEWTLEELASIEKGLMDQVDLSREGDDAR